MTNENGSTSRTNMSKAMNVAAWNVLNGTWTIEAAMNFLETVQEKPDEAGRVELVNGWYDFMVESNELADRLAAGIERIADLNEETVVFNAFEADLHN